MSGLRVIMLRGVNYARTDSVMCRIWEIEETLEALCFSGSSSATNHAKEKFQRS